jgi:hypothetical protein
MKSIIVDLILLVVALASFDNGRKFDKRVEIGKAIKYAFWSIAWCAMLWSFPFDLFKRYFGHHEVWETCTLFWGGITLLPIVATFLYLNYNLKRKN